MTRAESISLARIHARKLESLTAELTEMVRAVNVAGAAEALPVVNNELHILAGHIAALISDSRNQYVEKQTARTKGSPRQQAVSRG